MRSHDRDLGDNAEGFHHQNKRHELVTDAATDSAISHAIMSYSAGILIKPQNVQQHKRNVDIQQRHAGVLSSKLAMLIAALSFGTEPPRHGGMFI